MDTRPVRNAVRRACLLMVVAACLGEGAQVMAQRTRFPTPVVPETGSAPATWGESPSSPGWVPVPSSGPSGGTTGPSSTYPSYPPTPSGTGGATSGLAPSYSSPGPVPVTPGTVPGPSATYPGGGAAPGLGRVQPPPATWDPYGPPASTQAPSLLPQDYGPAAPGWGAPGWGAPAWAMPEKMQRFLDKLRLDYHYLAPRGSKKFGTNDLDLSSTFAFPFFGYAEMPIRVTPGFAFHWWDGPNQSGVIPGILGHLPPRVYDAYLDTAWNPRITRELGGELAFRVGVYSDFSQVTAQSLRYTGQGLLSLALPSSGATGAPTVTLKAGIVYLDRVRVKLLPAGGVVWVPNEDVRLEILFPNPRIVRRMTTVGNTDWWLYGRGEYGGGSWTVKPDKASGPLDQVDYNDLRAAVGLEFDRPSRLSGLAEVGVSFDRELLVRTTREKYSPSTTIFFRGGLVY